MRRITFDYGEAVAAYAIGEWARICWRFVFREKGA
jgi:hypothetical protein